jgi:hypothetical protein
LAGSTGLPRHDGDPVGADEPASGGNQKRCSHVSSREHQSNKQASGHVADAVSAGKDGKPEAATVSRQHLGGCCLLNGLLDGDVDQTMQSQRSATQIPMIQRQQVSLWQRQWRSRRRGCASSAFDRRAVRRELSDTAHRVVHRVEQHGHRQRACLLSRLPRTRLVRLARICGHRGPDPFDDRNNVEKQ